MQIRKYVWFSLMANAKLYEPPKRLTPVFFVRRVFPAVFACLYVLNCHNREGPRPGLQAQPRAAGKCGFVQNRLGAQKRPFRTLFNPGSGTISVAVSVACKQRYAKTRVSPSPHGCVSRCVSQGETPRQETRQQTAHPPAIAAVLDLSPVRTAKGNRG